MLTRIALADVLTRYEDAIVRALQDDLADQDFVSICRRSGKSLGELALEKIPSEKQHEDAMRHILRTAPA